MESLNWLILQRIYLDWFSYSYCFSFDYNYSSFALRLQTSQHLILDLLYVVGKVVQLCPRGWGSIQSRLKGVGMKCQK